MPVCNFNFLTMSSWTTNSLREGIVRDSIEKDLVGVSQSGNNIAHNDGFLQFDAYEPRLSDDGDGHHQRRTTPRLAMNRRRIVGLFMSDRSLR